jgi:hypothetical protein
MQSAANGTKYRSVIIQVAFLGAALGLPGCGTSALPPPVGISFRPSALGIGQVAVISNSSGHHLYNVRVVGRNFNDLSSASVKVSEHLAPGSTVEVGWFEFEKWVPQPGETIEVYADNFVTPAIAIIPSK